MLRSLLSLVPYNSRTPIPAQALHGPCTVFNRFREEQVPVRGPQGLLEVLMRSFSTPFLRPFLRPTQTQICPWKVVQTHWNFQRPLLRSIRLAYQSLKRVHTEDSASVRMRTRTVHQTKLNEGAPDHCMNFVALQEERVVHLRFPTFPNDPRVFGTRFAWWTLWAR
jgi:hypothetical protein